MKVVSLIGLATVLLTCGVRAESVTTQASANVLAPETVKASDIGLTQRSIVVDIPAGCKLLVLYRIYHEQKIDDKNPPMCRIQIPGKRGGKVVVEVAVLDPDVLNPQPTDKIKLTLPPLSGRWLTAKEKTLTTISGGFSNPLEIGQNYKVTDLQVGGSRKSNIGGVVTAARPPEWRVTVVLRLEHLDAKEMAAQVDHVREFFYPGEKFPLAAEVGD